MLSPKKTKFRKAFKGKIHGIARTGCSLSFGAFGLRAVEPGRLTSNQIESARRAISRAVKRAGRFWIRLFPHLPVTAKPIEVRMGGGKGALSHYVARVYPGTMLFELDGVDELLAKKAFELASAKLPFAAKFVRREEGVYATYD
jgi:large subunit ribosomal protein L16